MRGITAKQRKFIEAYLANGGNAAAAHRTAYDTKASPARAAQEASRLLQHPKLAPLVAEARRR